MKVRNLLPALSLTLCLSSIVDRVHAGSVQGDANGVTVEFTTTDKPSTPPPTPEPSDTPAPNAAIIFLPAGSDIASASSNGNVLLTDGATYSRWINGVVTKAFDVVQPDGYYNSPSDFVSSGDWVTINSLGAAVQWVQSSYCKDNGYSISSSNVLNYSISAGAAVEQYQPPYIHYSKHWDDDVFAPMMNYYNQPLQVCMLDVSNQLWMQVFKAPDGTTDLGDSYPDPEFYKLDLATGVRQALDPNIADLLVNESGQFISTFRTPDNVGSTYTSYFQGKDITANNPVYLASSGSYLGRSSSVQNGQLIYSFTVYYQDGTSLALPVVVNSYAGWGGQGVPCTYRFDCIDQFDQVHLCANNDATGKPYGPDMCLRRKRDSQGNLITPLQWEDVGMQQVIPPAPWTTNHQVSKGQWGVQAGYAWTSDDDPGQSVQFVPMSMAVDMNRDGTISLPSESSVDLTSQSKPYRFWINDCIDGPSTAPGESAVQDDLEPGTATANCDQGYITCTRDLENFARLWIDMKGLVPILTDPNNTMQIGLKWKNTNGTTPAIEIYASADHTGSASYLTDPTGAAQQAQTSGQFLSVIRDANDKQFVDAESTFIIPASAWTGLTLANPVLHLLFEGESAGTGQLTLVILDKVGNELGEGPSVYMDLRDIKEFYERWTVGDGPASGTFSTGGGGSPLPSAGISTDRLPTGVQQGFQYSSGDPGLSLPGDPTQNDYILFVHGWNVPPWDKDAFAETALKRLYWQGYKGKFGTFEWPTTYSDSQYEWFNKLSKIASYDNGEYTAWQSAVPLAQLLGTLHGAYGNNVYLLAHSMGNVVAGEALRLAGQQGMTNVVNTYVATQAAVPGHCYDPALPNMLLNYTDPTVTPNIYSDWLVPPNQSVGTHANFYNANDYALFYWRLDQSLKPDGMIVDGDGYGYTGQNINTIQDDFEKSGPPYLTQTSLHLGTAATVQDRYEVMAYASQPWSNALGAVPNVAGFAPQNLPGVWPHDPFETDPTLLYSDHPWHSAEFRFTNADQANYWNALMKRFGLPTNQ